MANEAEITRTSYATVVASDAVVDGGYSDATRTAIGTAVGATGADYPLIDFKLSITSGTPTEGGTIDVYRIPSDGTDQSEDIEADYEPHYVGSFVLPDNGTSYCYLYGVSNVDSNDEFMWKNNDGAITLTCLLEARTRTIVPGS